MLSKRHIEETKGHYNSPKIEEKKIKICRNSRNYGYLSHALELFNGIGFCFSFRHLVIKYSGCVCIRAKASCLF